MKKDELAYSANHTYREGYEDGAEDGIDEFGNWLVKYKVVGEYAMTELLRDFKCDRSV